MIKIKKFNKSISFGVSEADKQKLQEKAEELGTSLAGMIRNIVLEKYQTLQIGYVSYTTIPETQAIYKRKLIHPGKPKPITKEEISMKECINELKEVFSKGLTILGNMEDSELGIKTEDELEEISRKTELKIIQKEKEEIENVGS